MNGKLGSTIVALGLLFLTAATARAQGPDLDAARERLSDLTVEIAEKQLQSSPAPADEAYYRYMLAVYKKDGEALEQAEEIYSHLGTEESRAYLGSLESLKARDFAGGGAVGTILSFTPAGLIRLKRVYSSVSAMDRAVEENPGNPEIRIVRAWTLLNLPRLFRQFDKGYGDMEWILDHIKTRQVKITGNPLKDDRASLYLLAGFYYQENGETGKAVTMFKKAAEEQNGSPSESAARKALHLNRAEQGTENGKI